MTKEALKIRLELMGCRVITLAILEESFGFNHRYMCCVSRPNFETATTIVRDSWDECLAEMVEIMGGAIIYNNRL